MTTDTIDHELDMDLSWTGSQVNFPDRHAHSALIIALEAGFRERNNFYGKSPD
jgi:hypothetical protein